MFDDLEKLTLEEVSEEIAKTLDKLEILQNLYSALDVQEHRRVEKLVQEYNVTKRKEKESSMISPP